MALQPGSTLGGFEIVAPLGAGGMGEVYRARDARLDREVAVKVLPAELSRDPSALARFEREAKAVAALSHPNILSIHDFGEADGIAYAVMELLEGETLRTKLIGGALTPRKALDYALQIARGLAAAHEKNIVHRDLKPENIFVTRDGRVKILDFGLAKQTLTARTHGDESFPTVPHRTEPGTVLGTAGYMSPEQVRGYPADRRSDIFSFGAVLYEMLTGKRAFRGESAVETMNAVLREDPPELSGASTLLSPALDRIVRHCLEKSPDERFHDAHDLAFALESAAVSPSAPYPGIPTLPVERPGASRRLSRAALAALGAAVLVALGFVVGRALSHVPPATFRQISFRRGTVNAARFAPDGQTIVYSAAWDGEPPQIFAVRTDSPESRFLGLPPGDLLAISVAGDMAIALGGGRGTGGTLAQVPLGGGAPREVLEGVEAADWAPAGAPIAVVRTIGGKSRLELPIGKILYESTGSIDTPRISPKGDLVAFVDHPLTGDTAGFVAVADMTGKSRTLTRVWDDLRGLCWHPGSNEVWFTASDAGPNDVLWAAPLSGPARLVSRIAGQMIVQDVSRDGRALVVRGSSRNGMPVVAPGHAERDLYWLDGSTVTDISDDAAHVLFVEGREGGGQDGSVYLRKSDGSAAVRLGKGFASALSPDGKWALSTPFSTPAQFVLLPTGVGEPVAVTRDSLHHQRGRFFPDGKRLVFSAREKGKGPRLFVQDVSGGTPRPITPEGIDVEEFALSPDASRVAAVDGDRKLMLFPVAGTGEPARVAGAVDGDLPIRFDAVGSTLWVVRAKEVPGRVFAIDLRTGERVAARTLEPRDPTGVAGLERVRLTPDGNGYAYSYRRNLSELYLVEGLR